MENEVMQGLCSVLFEDTIVHRSNQQSTLLKLWLPLWGVALSIIKGCIRNIEALEGAMV